MPEHFATRNKRSTDWTNWDYDVLFSGQIIAITHERRVQALSDNVKQIICKLNATNRNLVSSKQLKERSTFRQVNISKRTNNLGQREFADRQLLHLARHGLPLSYIDLIQMLWICKRSPQQHISLLKDILNCFVSFLVFYLLCNRRISAAPSVMQIGSFISIIVGL